MRFQRRQLEGVAYYVQLSDDDRTTAASLHFGQLGKGAAPRELLERLSGPDASLLPPVYPGKIVCVGLNYRAHAEEMGKALPEEPLIFLKPPSAVVASGESIVLPHASTDVHYEGEVAVVMGKVAKDVEEANALSYVLGYTLMNDVTARDIQRKEQRYTRAKGFDTFAPLGPTIITHQQPETMQLETRVNGELRQRSGLDDLIFSIPALIAFVSRVMTLEPGDVLSTGTPSGVGSLHEGDVVEVSVPEIGTLSNPVTRHD